MAALGFQLDWQFLVVTGAALVAVGLIVRPYLPAQRRKSGGGCISCASGADACKSASPEPAGGKLVTLGSGRRSSS